MLSIWFEVIVAVAATRALRCFLLAALEEIHGCSSSSSVSSCGAANIPCSVRCSDRNVWLRGGVKPSGYASTKGVAVFT
jgi:hypothetical protein